MFEKFKDRKQVSKRIKTEKELMQEKRRIKRNERYTEIFID